MPFLSYQASTEEAIRNGGRFLKEAGMQAVKVEGVGPALTAVEAMVKAGIPVMGHLGYTPQSVHRFGSHVVQGRTGRAAAQLIDDALALEAAGIFALVLECVPAEVARLVTERVTIATIGIGAGPFCDGQILVFHDVMGMTRDNFRFVKRYAGLADTIRQAAGTYAAEVRDGAFPAAAHSFSMPADEERRLLDLLFQDKDV
jgi:3-methyl-2-oxobutanoate hydroxymethyltransferase